MTKSLVVVESPAKAKTINKYLGRDFKVVASMGHIRDLPKSKLGVDVDNDFTEQYESILSRKKVIKELKDAAKDASDIYVATDPDREGEAIGWHLAQELGGKKRKIHRLLFNEITKKAILEAFKHPKDIDEKMVDAQRARRVLDRLVGYKISPLLWDKVRRGLSAGRVQSVAQQLYEGIELPELGAEGAVGLITYMRTDSVRVSDDAIAAVRDHIKSTFGDDYLPEKAVVFKTKSDAQDAHEAIRPTSMQYDPETVRPYLTQ